MINHYNTSHKGHLPIRVLQHNIIKQFETTTANFLNETLDTIKNKGLKTEICYTVNKSSYDGEKVIGPFVYTKSKILNIHETFLAYLWCMTFSLYRYTDLIISEQLKDDNEQKNLTDKVFTYALSLIDGYHDWDKNSLPNPECYDKHLAADIEKTNELFLYGFNFVMCHEYSHVDLGHCDSIELTKGFLTDLEKKEFEQAADDNAVRLFSEGVYPGNEAATKYGVSMALSSLLFFNSKVSKKIHPDTDMRIMNALNALQIDDNDKSWLVPCAALALWSTTHSIDLNWQEKKSFKDLFRSLVHQLD